MFDKKFDPVWLMPIYKQRLGSMFNERQKVCGGGEELNLKADIQGKKTGITHVQDQYKTNPTIMFYIYIYIYIYIHTHTLPAFYMQMFDSVIFTG